MYACMYVVKPLLNSIKFDFSPKDLKNRENRDMLLILFYAKHKSMKYYIQIHINYINYIIIYISISIFLAPKTFPASNIKLLKSCIF